MSDMRYFEATVVENRSLDGGYWMLRLSGCEGLAGATPGQFVMLRGDWERDPLLPRAFSLMRVGLGGGGQAEILAKTVGRGTALLERVAVGTRVFVLGPLGKRFPEPSRDHLDLLVAGGVGMPPILMQAEWAAARGFASQCEIIYGGRSARDLLLLEDMRKLGAGLHLTTEDGSAGTHGRVTAVLEARLAALHGKPVRVMACGPNPMLWAVGKMARQLGVPCYLSLEEVMACGIGVCLGCAVPGRTRPFRYVCKDGPVFEADEVMLGE